jgi:hypothetical protein
MKIVSERRTFALRWPERNSSGESFSSKHIKNPLTEPIREACAMLSHFGDHAR